MSRKAQDRARTRRISVKRALRLNTPNESSAIRDSMGSSKRGWGAGLDIDSNGNKDLYDYIVMPQATEEEYEITEEYELNKEL